MLSEDDKKQVLHFLVEKFNGDVDKHLETINEEIERCVNLNRKYGSVQFRPFSIASLLDCKEFLLAVKEDGIAGDCNVDKEYINHPKHYGSGDKECINMMRKIYGDAWVNIWSELNTFKYMYREGVKAGIVDVNKALWYRDYINAHKATD